VPDNRIRGRIADPLDLPEGCAFHPRCPHAMDICMTAPRAVAAGASQVRCHLHDEAGPHDRSAEAAEASIFQQSQ